jgi:hypothetical protein
MSATPLSVTDIVLQRIVARTDRRVRNLEVVVATGGDSVVLRGCTTSYHVKQLAQQAAREALPHAQLENAIVVEANGAA